MWSLCTQHAYHAHHDPVPYKEPRRQLLGTCASLMPTMSQGGLCCLFLWLVAVQRLIGTTLTEPHTSRTAFCEYMCLFPSLGCLDWASTYCKFQMNEFTNVECPQPHALHFSLEREKEREKGYCQTVASAWERAKWRQQHTSQLTSCFYKLPELY